jgi:hypothetical protein
VAPGIFLDMNSIVCQTQESGVGITVKDNEEDSSPNLYINIA